MQLALLLPWFISSCKGESMQTAFRSALSDNANISVGLARVDLTVARSRGIDFEVSGDWLAVDYRSTGAARASFHTRQDDSDAVLLVPGRVYERPFQNLRVFNDPIANALSGPDGQPSLYLLYGRGRAPTQSSPFNASALACAISSVWAQAPTDAAALLSTSEGCVWDIDAQFTQVTGAAETSRLRALLAPSIFGVAAPGLIAPTQSDSLDVVPAGVGVARVFASWRGVVTPRGCTAFNVICRNLGNAATNNVVAAEFSARLR